MHYFEKFQSNQKSSEIITEHKAVTNTTDPSPHQYVSKTKCLLTMQPKINNFQEQSSCYKSELRKNTELTTPWSKTS